jgi:hypothetical protein
MSLNEQLQEAHSQSFGIEKKVLSNFSVGNASTTDNKVIHRTFEKPEELMEEQPDQEEQEEKEEDYGNFKPREITDFDALAITKAIHELISTSGRYGNFKSRKELEEMEPYHRKNIATGKVFEKQKELLAFLAKHNLTEQFCKDVDQQLSVMDLCWRYQTSYELMRTVAKELQTPFKAPPAKEKPKKKLPDNFLLAEMVGKISKLEEQIKALREEHTVLNKIVRDVSSLIRVTHDKLGEIREYTEVEWHDETTY